MLKRHLDQSKAIMIAIKYCGDIVPGQKCSAVYVDEAGVRQEKAFYERFCRGNGMTSPALIEAMVAAHVPDKPYWLVSFKPADGAIVTTKEEIRYQKVDDETGQAIPDAPW